MFRRETVPEAAFAGPMEVATSSGPLLEHLVAIHAVEGVAPNATRETTEHLTLDQPLGGDAAYTVFHAVDLDRVLDLGPRAYRAANFEAGLGAGRLQLAAFSVGLGATGLTFYDDEVRKVFASGASCLLVTAVGVPAYRSTAGGAPGRPSQLRGFDLLTTRLQRQLYEHRRWTTDDNRRVLPFGWGLEHIGGRADEPDPRGFLPERPVRCRRRSPGRKRCPPCREPFRRRARPARARYRAP